MDSGRGDDEGGAREFEDSHSVSKSVSQYVSQSVSQSVGQLVYQSGSQVVGEDQMDAGRGDDALHPTPCTLHPAPCTLHPATYTLHPTPWQWERT